MKQRLSSLILVPLLLLSLFACSLDSTSNLPALQPAAHRGVRSLAVDNSSSGITIARNAGIPYVEVDIRRLNDGTLVLFHDKHLNNEKLLLPKDWKEKRIEDLDFKSMQKISWNDPEHSKIASFDSIIKIVKGSNTNLLLDLKNGEVERLQQISKTISEPNSRSRIIIQCQELLCMHSVRETSPPLKLLARVHSPKDLPEILALKPDLVQIDAKILSPLIISQIKQAGAKVYVKALDSELDSQTGWQKLANQGVDVVLTDYPLELQKYFLKLTAP